MRSPAPALGARFWSVIGATFLGFLGIGTVLPSLAPHVRRDLGGTDQTIGLVIGIFSFVALAARFVSGPLADRKGRKIAFIAGLASCALAGVAYLLPIGIASAYLGRMLQGFGEACLYTGAAAWAIEIAGVHRSGRALGFVSSGIWGGISAGPVLGHWMGSFERAAMLQALLALAGIALLLRIPEEYSPEPNEVKRRWIPVSLIWPGVAIGLVNVHYPVIAGFLILHLTAHGNSGPASFSAYAGLVLLSRFFLGGLPDRINPAVTFFGGISAMAIGLTLLAVGPPPAVAVAAAALLGFGFSFPFASVASTVIRRTPAGQRGSAVGVLSAFYDLFVGTSSFAAGAVAKNWGYPAAFVMGATALIAAAAVGRIVFGQAARDRAGERELCPAAE